MDDIIEPDVGLEVLKGELWKLYLIFKELAVENPEGFQAAFGLADKSVEDSTPCNITGDATVFRRPDFEVLADVVRTDCLVPVRPNPEELSTPLQSNALVVYATSTGDFRFNKFPSKW